MIKKRKSSESRERELQLTLYRIERNNTKSGEKITIAAVAREAGVSAALIHNYYPKIAEAIRIIQGRSSRAQKNIKNLELRAAKEKNQALRQEIEILRARVATLASLNETLIYENKTLRANYGEPKIIALR